jgi:serine/threonine protein kinase
MGTPTEEDLEAMNPEYTTGGRLPKLEPQNLVDLFPSSSEKNAVDLISKMLVYNPNKRIGLYKAMAHPLFNELRKEDLILPNGNCVPDLFNFSE